MEIFNYYGLAIVVVILIPNIVYAIKNKNKPTDRRVNKALEISEQIGRYGCMAFMIVNVPYACLGFWFDKALAVYLTVNGILCAAYYAFWVICKNGKGKLRAVSLSVLPSCVFVFSGTVSANFPLIAFALTFSVCHITISCKNA